jgi:hypothetical protein
VTPEVMAIQRALEPFQSNNMLHKWIWTILLDMKSTEIPFTSAYWACGARKKPYFGTI